MDTGKLTTLFDNPEARTMVYGLAHVYPAEPGESGPERLRGVMQRVVETAEPEQVQSWLSDDDGNRAITVEQVRTAFGDDVIEDLASYADSGPDETAWQLTAVLPDLVDAFSPDGAIVEIDELRDGFFGATDAADRSSGPFGFHTG
jgi:uncharacterized protein YidB (DUF937 family)